MDLIDSLNQILEWHRRNNTPAARLLQPGLSEDQILGRLQAVPFRLSREFVELYKWRNGTAIGAEGEDTSFFEIHRFLPLDEALELFQQNYPAQKDFYEPADWVQVFRDEAGDGYGLASGPHAAERTPVIFLFEGEGAQVVFNSLAKMMQTVAAAFKEGAMGWEDEELETDFFAWGQIARRINPEIKYWRDYIEGGG